jgi:hypothetical protein
VCTSPAADNAAVICGSVEEKGGEKLIGANVVLKGTKQGGRTDANGRYWIPAVRPGLYAVEAGYIGYAHVTKSVVVRAGDTVNVDFLLEVSAFAIGGMEVIGTTDLLPREAETKTTISAAEIEHFQASSIGDVLDLVPGIQKTENPGLGKTSQISVRGDPGDPLSAFGTLVMVDGVPLSNNADLQFERFTKGFTGVSTLGRGADLRLIPADNVQSIEVVTGVPSVRFGDATSGVVNVQTKIGPQPHRLKVKANPDTREANLGGGFSMGNSGLSYNLNGAQSERDVRKEGDEYSRLTGQLVFNQSILEDALTFNAKLHGQKVFDEEEPKGDAQQTRNYNRGYTLGTVLWGKYGMPFGVSEIEYNAYLTYRKEDSFRSKLVQSDLRILPNGDTVSTYLGNVETLGAEWTAGGRLEWSNTFFTGDFIHRAIIGTDIQYNANTGEGVIVDSIYNYYGSQSGRISYSFDSIPGQLLASVYAEDRISGHLGVNVSLTIGLRYEIYQPYGFDVKGLWGGGDLVKSHQGSYLNPRMTLLVALSASNQIRLSAGYTSKSPPMASIYPPPDVLRWRNPVTASLFYYRPDLHVPDLKGYREGQVELAFDQKLFGAIGTSLTGYLRKRSNEPEQESTPVFAYADDSGTPRVYYVDYYSVYRNLGWTETKGVEFSLKTNRILPLNMDFNVVGSYSYSKFGRWGTSWDDTPDPSFGQYPNYRVPNVPIDTLIGFVYPAKGEWNDRLLINYYMRYTHPSLGLWVTIRAEQLVFERLQYFNVEPVNYALLTESDLAQQSYEESIHPKYVKWLFSLNISKSLWRGAEVSFYVNNFMDNPAIGRYMMSATTYSDQSRNPPLFYGIEFSMIADDLLGGGKQ